MTANLLAHTNLFHAGLAESGAYKRTLTPFGFQSERRTFWEAPDVYELVEKRHCEVPSPISGDVKPLPRPNWIVVGSCSAKFSRSHLSASTLESFFNKLLYHHVALLERERN